MSSDVALLYGFDKITFSSNYESSNTISVKGHCILDRQTIAMTMTTDKIQPRSPPKGKVCDFVVDHYSDSIFQRSIIDRQDEVEK